MAFRYSPVGEGHVATEAETGGMWPQAEGHGGGPGHPRKLGEARVLPGAFGERMPSVFCLQMENRALVHAPCLGTV